MDIFLENYVSSLFEKDTIENFKQTVNQDRQVKLCSYDNINFTVPLCLIKYMFVIHSFMEDYVEDMNDTDDTEEDYFPLKDSSCTKNVMEQVINWCFWNHALCNPETSGFFYKDDSTLFQNGVNNWIANMEHKLLEDVGECCNYLDIQQLIRHMGKGIANMVSKCDTVEQIRNIFGVEDDWDHEERLKMQKTVEWLNSDKTMDMDIDV